MSFTVRTGIENNFGISGIYTIKLIWHKNIEKSTFGFKKMPTEFKVSYAAVFDLSRRVCHLCKVFSIFNCFRKLFVQGFWKEECQKSATESKNAVDDLG